VECVAHAGTPATEVCDKCQKPRCEACLTYEIDGNSVCTECGEAEQDRGRGFGTAILGIVSVGYLATLAIGYLVFKAKPFVGGLAAVVAIVLGRALQMLVRRSDLRS
jgi:hypothetical protein